MQLYRDKQTEHTHTQSSSATDLGLSSGVAGLDEDLANSYVLAHCHQSWLQHLPRPQDGDPTHLVGGKGLTPSPAHTHTHLPCKPLAKIGLLMGCFYSDILHTHTHTDA